MRDKIGIVILWIISIIGPVHAQVVRFEAGHADQVLHYVKPYLPKSPIIVEAGAYDGADTHRLARFWNQGRVYAFEPVPELFQKVQAVVQRLPNARCYQKALSNANGTATFYLSVLESDPQHVSASSSLLPPKEHLIKTPELSFPSTLEVPTVTLDEWARQENVHHVDFLWLDMQGFELNMLDQSQLARGARAIWLEVTFIEAYERQYVFNDVREWMAQNGFQLAATDFNLTKPEHWFGNALFIKRP